MGAHTHHFQPRAPTSIQGVAALKPAFWLFGALGRVSNTFLTLSLYCLRACNGSLLSDTSHPALKASHGLPSL